MASQKLTNDGKTKVQYTFFVIKTSTVTNQVNIKMKNESRKRQMFISGLYKIDLLSHVTGDRL